jgi:hypothetical protein
MNNRPPLETVVALAARETFCSAPFKTTVLTAIALSYWYAPLERVV